MIAEQIHRLHAQLPPHVKLIAVSKFHPAECIQEAYEAGQRRFGENHVQEMVQKRDLLPADIEWHFIGHLQTNKVKYIVPFVTLIHGVDSLKLLQTIDKEARKVGRVVPCLLQIHIAHEETKFGFSPDECLEMLASDAWKELTHVRLCGLMGMATFTDDTQEIRREFRALHQLFQECKQQYFAHDEAFTELSMGMSDDYHIAIEEGSTMVRIGTSIFGERDYSKK